METGELAKDKDVQIGFLKQDIDFEEGRSVIEEAHQAFSEIKKLEAEIDHINHQLAERTDYESEAYHQLIVDVSEKQTRYEFLGLTQSYV